MKLTTNFFLTRTSAFVGIWLCVRILLSIIEADSGIEVMQQVTGGVWIVVGIGIYCWKIWNQDKTAFKKILLGLLTWVEISLSGTLIGLLLVLIGLPQGLGNMLVTYLYLISKLHEGMVHDK